MEKYAIILSNGLIEQPTILRDRMQSIDDAIVIAVDGGHRHAELLGLQLHTILGDLDSIDQKTMEKFTHQGIRVQTFPADKDATDLELALLHAASLGVDKILILGAMGGRLDMTISNLHLLCLPLLSEIHVEIWHGHQTAWIIRPPGGEACGEPGDTLSLIPMAGPAQRITTHGLKFALKDDELNIGLSRGVSNVLTDRVAEIELQEGFLLAIHTPGRA